MTRPARLDRVAVPATLDVALSPEWLTAALQSRFPEVEVRTVQRGPVVERLSTNARFTIECAGTPPPRLPQQLCVKGYFGPAGRAIGFVGEPEATFYRDLAAATGVRTLRCVYADVDPGSRHGVIVTADEVAAGGEFLDADSVVALGQVSDALDELARLHAKTWMNRACSTLSWLAPRLGRAVDAWGTPRALEIMTANLTGPNGVDVPPRVRDAASVLAAHKLVSARVPTAESQGWCVIHGDAHVGNMVLDSRRQPSIVDWQLVQCGFWQIDVGYLIASSLPPELRCDAESELLRHYLERLAAHGVHPPSFDEAWQLVRDGMVHGFFLWTITTKVRQDLIAVMLHRLGTAVADHVGATL